MKKLLLISFAIITMSCGSEKILIEGTLSNIGDKSIKIYVRDSSTEKRLIGQTESVNDNFHLKIRNIKTPTYAYLSTIGSEVQFVLEPGKIRIVPGGDYTPIVSGTKYNNMLYVWKTSPEAARIDSSSMVLGELIKDPDYESRSDEYKNEIKAKFGKVRKEKSLLENKALDEMFKASDEYGQLFSILFRYRTTEKEMEELLRIEKVVGKNGEIDHFREVYNEENRAKNQREKISIGKDYIDITATESTGKEVKLSEAVTKNKLTMLEFWASWCAPCRAEIPHMKEVYDHYKNKGFEIFSFSVDTNREAWLTAEKKENLPWISTSGDVDGVSELYVVESIPTSILIDSNGKIVAKNLRGTKLDKFVADFLK